MVGQIIVHSSLENQDEILENKSNGIRENNKIEYLEDGVNVMILIEESRILLKRENEEYRLEFIFDKKENSTGIYYIKEEDIYLEIPIQTNTLMIHENKIELEYELIQDGYTDQKRYILLFEVR